MHDKKIWIFSVLLISLSITGYQVYQNLNRPTGNMGSVRPVMFNPPIAQSNLYSRSGWELQRLQNPETGTIPDDIRVKELAFAGHMPVARSLFRNSVWMQRGPYNVGGRTRAAVIDANNHDRILAGGISGGIWESTDAGNNWHKVTPPDQLHSITCLVQDQRKNKNNIWYYGTGEGYGNSASGSGAFFAGNGIYKSVDNGKTWQSLDATASNTPQFDKLWDVVWNLSTDSSRHDSDIVYAATLGAIFRSNDGGTSWTKMIGGNTSAFAYFAHVMATPDGSVYAALSNDGPGKGIWHALDGLHFTNITPDSFPPEYKRIVMDFNPQNPNSVYFLAHTPGYGKLGLGYKGTKDWNSLWKYEYTGLKNGKEKGRWTDLSQNLPAHAKKGFDDFNAQGSYNLAIRFYPTDSHVVFIAGTNVYRSTDALLSDSNTRQIGGYGVHTHRPKWTVYKNHHPDQHVMLFDQDKPLLLYNFNDGGAFVTTNCFADTVSWTPLNNGYFTTQVYTVNFEEEAANDILIGGFQDNGNYFTATANTTSPWVMPMNGDGSHSAIASGHKYYIFSSQLGKMAKFDLDDNGNPKNFTRIDPIGGRDYLFINPFALDPNDDNILYVPAGTHLWRNNEVNSLPYLNNYDSISTGWTVLTDTINVPNRKISCIAVTKQNPAHRVYLGTSSRYIYRIDNAHTGDPELLRVNQAKLPNAYVSSIAVDPYDGNILLASYSNYGVVSLVYSVDGGDNWVPVAGNLEENVNGSGNGPSVRSVAILYLPDGKLYFAGTSTGLYATDTLRGDATFWQEVAADDIGNVVVETVKTRNNDGLVVVGTHGLGIFSAKIKSVHELLSLPGKYNQISLKITPNPASDYLRISGSKLQEPMAVSILDMSGQVVLQSAISQNEQLNISGLKNGMYFVKIRDHNGKTGLGRFVKVLP